MSVEPQPQLSADELSAERLSALAEETMMTVGESIVMTEKGARLYDLFCKQRIANAEANHLEDCKIRDMFIKEEAVASSAAAEKAETKEH